MDDYRKHLLGAVRRQPLLWDPSNKDYKNKELRFLKWQEIDGKIKAPYGTDVTAKPTWEQLNRSFCNALKRQEKKSGGRVTSGNNKEWRFLKDMMFLLPARKHHQVAGRQMVLHLDDGTGEYGDVQEDSLEALLEEGVEGGEFIKQEGSESRVGGACVEQAHCSYKRQRLMNNQEETHEGRELTRLLIQQQLQLQQNAESVRFNFFKSIMPRIDAMTDDDFIGFQIDVLQCIQRRRTLLPIASSNPSLNHEQPTAMDNNHYSRLSFEHS